jgi:hypothetical protein
LIVGRKKLPKGHNWSGWPGAYCTKCGCEQALENALADGWFDITSEARWISTRSVSVPSEWWWKSSAHQALVHACDNNCMADMNWWQRFWFRRRVRRIERQIKKTKE